MSPNSFRARSSKASTSLNCAAHPVPGDPTSATICTLPTGPRADNSPRTVAVDGRPNTVGGAAR